MGVVRLIGTDDHLCALPGGEGAFFTALLLFVSGNFSADLMHRLASAAHIFFGSKSGEIFLARELDVDADPVSILSGFCDEVIRCFGDGFEMNVAFEMMKLPKGLSDLHHLLHCEVSAADNSRAEEESFNVVPLVEIEGELNNFLGREAGPADIAGAAVNAIVAIVEADVGQQDL